MVIDRQLQYLTQILDNFLYMLLAEQGNESIGTCVLETSGQDMNVKN